MKEISLLCFIFSRFFFFIILEFVVIVCAFAPFNCKCGLIDNLFHVLILNGKNIYIC